MACFVVPAVEAIAVTAVAAAAKKHEKQQAAAERLTLAQYDDTLSESGIIRKSRKLGWLCGMLWGGAALLMFEHIWHGEVSPVFPFLTAASSRDTALVMLREMGTVGVAMAAAVTAVWGAVCAAVGKIARRVTE